MKKCQCGFETGINSYNICPICGKQLEIDKGKRKYLMGLSAEESYEKEIEMTYEEAKIVDRVLKELNYGAKSWCGRCWIDFE